jgi:hypothetical protein
VATEQWAEPPPSTVLVMKGGYATGFQQGGLSDFFGLCGIY